MKQTIDSSLRNESKKWWIDIGLGKRNSLLHKYNLDLPTDAELENIYQQETNPKAIIGSGVEEKKGWNYKEFNNPKITPTFIIQNYAGDTICRMNRDDAPSNDIQRVWANEICEAVNNYQALRDRNDELKIALEKALEVLREHGTMYGYGYEVLEKAKSLIQ